MLSLKGNSVYLRALEPEDLDYLYQVENNEKLWEVSTSNTPYSRFILKQYLENSHKDIYQVKQLRMVICELEGTPIGFVDVFDFEPRHQRAALGILISGESSRSKGYGAEALKLVCGYCFSHLAMHQVYACVGEDNRASRRLFEKEGFKMTGRKKEWNLIKGKFRDELIYQLIRNVH